MPMIRLAVACYLHIQLDDFQRLSVLPASVTGLMLGEKLATFIYGPTSGTLPEKGK